MTRVITLWLLVIIFVEMTMPGALKCSQLNSASFLVNDVINKEIQDLTQFAEGVRLYYVVCHLRSEWSEFDVSYK